MAVRLGALTPSTALLTTTILILPLCFLWAVILPADALFVCPPSTIKPYPDLKLRTADRLGVPYRGFAYDAGNEASLPSFALSLDADFGQLDRTTFDSLKYAYCSWSETKSRVKWKEGRTYTLLDFLPPLLQATSGLHFRSGRRKSKGRLPSFLGGPMDRVKRRTAQEILLTTNCWGFAWEVLFQADNDDVRAMTVSAADTTSAWNAFTGPGFDLIQTSRTKPELLTDKSARNRKLQGGDVILIWHKIPGQDKGGLYLDHVAILIDEDVIYEKSGSGDNVPFRINTWEGLTRNWPPAVFYWEWRRLVRNNRTSPSLYGRSESRLRPASEIFGVDAQVENANTHPKFSVLSELRPSVAKRLSLTAEVSGGGDDGTVEAQLYTGIEVLEDIVFDGDTGRASLPRSAFDPKFYKGLPDLPRDPYL